MRGAHAGVLHRAGGAGEAVNVPRRRLKLATGTVMHQMAGAWGGYLGTKIYATNVKRGAMHFHVLLYDAASAEPLALIEANHLGQMRTGGGDGRGDGPCWLRRR
jgi:ornithine cyclodeaminase/alanine dehydrogenase-like protein (mu-crystallin family)